MIMEVLYIPLKYKLKLNEAFMYKILNEVKDNSLCLFSTIQFLEQAKQLYKFLKAKGKKVYFPKPLFRAVEQGQVLGCDVTGPISVKNKVDTFIFLGNGRFHPLAVAYQTQKPVYIADPVTSSLSLIDKKDVENYQKQIKGKLMKFAMAQKVGILISTKLGQYNLKLARILKKKLLSKGKEVILFMFETLIPESLSDFKDIDFWINTACPRIAIDDYERFEKPILNADEVLSLL